MSEEVLESLREEYSDIIGTGHSPSEYNQNYFWSSTDFSNILNSIINSLKSIISRNYQSFCNLRTAQPRFFPFESRLSAIEGDFLFVSNENWAIEFLNFFMYS